MDHSEQLAQIAQTIAQMPVGGCRRLVALAGPPASGKSTLAQALADLLAAQGEAAQVVPMDGFHIDNALLEARGLLARKGAPETFDAAGFVHLIRRLKDEAEVVFPLFDRERDIAIAGAGQVTRATRTVIVEGNYLLFGRPPWAALAPLWDLSVRLVVPLPVLEARLVARWVALGLDPDAALARARSNDLPNAQAVMDHALPADVVLQGA